MNIIIVGCGKVGMELAKQLLVENHTITCIDNDPEVIAKINSTLNAIGYVGNGASFEMQEKAGITTADLLLAVTESDEVNLLSCLIAQKSGHAKTIARVRNPLYYQEASFFKQSLNLAMIINTDLAFAQEVSRVIRRPSALDINPFAKGKAELINVELNSESKLCGCTIADLYKKHKCDVLVCAVERKDECIIPDGSFVLEAGDRISYIASAQNSARFMSLACLNTKKIKNVLIMGGSRSAFYLAQTLIGHGFEVTIIEQNKNRAEELSELLDKAHIICGDASSPALLAEEGVDKADAICTLTNMDEENILMSLYAAGTNPGAKIITKVNHNNFDGITGSLNIGTVIDPKDMTTESILRYVRALQNSHRSNEIESLYRLFDDRVEALEFIIKEEDRATGKPLSELGAHMLDSTLIALISRNGKIFIPRGSDMILPGDSVVVVSKHLGITNIGDLFN